MKDIITLLEERTEESGSFTIQCNTHKQYHDTDPKEIAYDYLGAHPDKGTLEIFLHLDFSKPIYYIQWFPISPAGFYRLFANSKEEIIEQIKSIKE